MNARTCPVCGSHSFGPAATPSPGGTRRVVCKDCERRRLTDEERNVRALRSYAARIVTYGGLLLLLLTLLADRLPIAGQEGFGWRQITGLEVGAVCSLIGVVTRRGLIAVGGILLLVLSGAADLLQLGHAPGFGWRSRAVLAVSSLLVIAGMAWELAIRRGQTYDPSLN